MKYLLLLLLAFFTGGCGPCVYNIDIIYQDGTKESIRTNSCGYPNLDDGCLYFGSHDTYNQAIRCGIRSFTYTEEKTEAQ